MRYLTPDDVRNVAFAKPPIGKRGYNEDQVDSFLDDVEATLRDLYARLARYEGSSGPAAPERPEDRGFRRY
ncbi:DivIVA domain-containing protein [Tsukamurella paurometabola]|uniref:Cell wall synthesis protein Wag31 n=1 Tax=Tsukamurella paurometabola TaxID=2061 RepID=A0A3P8KZT5_TSUPA|nr:DivIVA domain-containing protein [Tsukamurella paurometabola]VDR37325.1 DivIVA domain [Tsukamurella paurometabola]